MDRLRPFAFRPDPSAAPAIPGMQFSELMGSLSHASTSPKGQPKGHCLRVCWIGMHIGMEIGLNVPALRELYYVLLLKDLGCSSNAARICELYLTDDLSFKRDFKTVGDGLPQVLRFVFGHTGLNAGLAGRLRSVVNILRNGRQITDELIRTRCTRGAAIARQLRFSDGVAAGIAGLDEHWDGSGRPEGVLGSAIPLFARIALLAQVVDVFHTVGGRAAAMHEARQRSGGWFQPDLVRTLEKVAEVPGFWLTLASPRSRRRSSPWTRARAASSSTTTTSTTSPPPSARSSTARALSRAGHSARVADVADAIARRIGLSDARCRWLRRGALLHDVGKLGVSNAVLDKPGPLDAAEWASVRLHAGTPRRSCRASAPFPSWPASPRRTTSGSTAAATRAASAATRSPSRPGSSPPPTSSMPSRPTGPTAPPCRCRRRWR
jgi:HD-GYP domain-containing protein (c-di-GMP phosphodiesterase class II)